MNHRTRTLTATLAAIMLAGLIYADLSPETLGNLTRLIKQARKEGR